MGGPDESAMFLVRALLKGEVRVEDLRPTVAARVLAALVELQARLVERAAAVEPARPGVGWATDYEGEVAHFYAHADGGAACGHDNEVVEPGCHGTACPECVQILASELERSASGPAGDGR